MEMFMKFPTCSSKRTKPADAWYIAPTSYARLPNGSIPRPQEFWSVGCFGMRWLEGQMLE